MFKNVIAGYASNKSPEISFFFFPVEKSLSKHPQKFFFFLIEIFFKIFLFQANSKISIKSVITSKFNFLRIFLFQTRSRI